MKMKMKMKWAGAALLALMGLAAGRAQALTGTSSYLLINVAITKTLSVSVNNVNASTQNVTWNGQTALAAGSIASVDNDSGFFSESWKLNTTAFSNDAGTGLTGWAIAGAPTLETVELQAVFVSATGGCPLATGTEWANPLIAPALTSAGFQTYSASLLADTTFGGGAANAQPSNTGTGQMSAGGIRGLCWRLGMPTSTNLSANQIVPVVVTAF
jgi:hypothetical protein